MKPDSLYTPGEFFKKMVHTATMKNSKQASLKMKSNYHIISQSHKS